MTINISTNCTFLRMYDAQELIENIAPAGWLEQFTDDQQIEIRHADDWESFEYYVVNGDTVLMTDGFGVLQICSAAQFLEETKSWVLEECTA